MCVHWWLTRGNFLKTIKHRICSIENANVCSELLWRKKRALYYLKNKPHFPLTSCRMQGIRKCPFGTTSVRTAPLVKRDELYLPGPAHYHQQSQPQGEQQGGGEDGKGANSKPQRLSHSFASTSKRLYSPPSIVTVSQSTQHTHHDRYC